MASAEPRGPYGWLTPYIVAIAAHNEAFAARVLVLSRAELHFIALVVSLMNEKANEVDHLGALARSYDVWARKMLMEEFVPDADPALAKLTSKFAGAVWRKASYRRLAALMEDGSAKKYFVHAKSISRRSLLAVSRLPAGYRSPNIIGKVRNRRALGELAFAIDMVRHIRTDLSDREIRESLERSKTRDFHGWVMTHYERAPFPAPPIAVHGGGADVIRPLSCYENLARSAREFDNCIRDYLWRVLRGDSYFYLYAPNPGGKGVAIIELRRAPIVGWMVHEMYGPKNDPVPASHRLAILAAFEKAGVKATPQARSDDGWFQLD